MARRSVITHFQVYLLTHRQVSRHTLHAYISDITQFCTFCTKILHKDLDQITHTEIKKFLRYLHEKEISARSIARKISTLKVFFRYAQEQFGYTDCMKHIHIPKLPKTLPKYLSEEELKTLLMVADQDTSDSGQRNRTMLYLLYTTGMRISELTQLKLSDFQLDSGFVQVVGKGTKQRLIPLPIIALSMLREYLKGFHAFFVKEHRTTDYLFPINHKGNIKPISRQAFWKILNNLWSKTGNTRRISPHQLRHSLATHLLKQGADLRSLQLILGHENLATMQLYTHLELHHVRKLYDKKHPRS